MNVAELLNPLEEEMEEDTEELASEPQFRHFKALFDYTWDHKKIAEKLFCPDHPYLVVKEHLNKPNTHVHFQGMSLLTENAFRRKVGRLAKKHVLRKDAPRCRPTSMSCRPVDVKGFQYMAKELTPASVLASNMFSMEQLAELKEKSVMHVKELKMAVPHIIAQMPKEEIEELYRRRKSTREFLNEVIAFMLKGEEQGRWVLPEYNEQFFRKSVIKGLWLRKDLPRQLRAEIA